MAAKPFLTIDAIIEKAGGCPKIAKDLGLAPSMVRAFRQEGISWWHFHYFARHGITADDIYKANVLAAGKKRQMPRNVVAAIKLEALGV